MLAQIDVDDELIAGEGPAVLGAGEQGDEAGVDDGDLGCGVGAAVGGARAAAGEPGVADETGIDIQRALGHDLALIHARSLDDHAQGASVGGRLPDMVESCVQILTRQLGLGVHRSANLRVRPTRPSERRAVSADVDWRRLTLDHSRITDSGQQDLIELS